MINYNDYPGGDMSKGSRTRPQDVNKFNENFEKIFGQKREAQKPKKKGKPNG
jgi:hypothetical protein|tara:strand:+ start:424 stop:579 length:156 start_codon:yes stop_codon:yes gene_type:complete